MSVETREIPLSDLRVPQPKVQELTTTEASLRLDAVASAGFRLSRSAFGDSIKSGDVRRGLAILHRCDPASWLDDALLCLHRSCCWPCPQACLPSFCEGRPSRAYPTSAAASLTGAREAGHGLALLRRLNWRVAKATAEVASGDMIACTGKGRLEVGDISQTAKGRFRIQLTRFL